MQGFQVQVPSRARTFECSFHHLSYKTPQIEYCSTSQTLSQKIVGKGRANSENMGANLEKMEHGGLGIWQWTLSQRVMNFMCGQTFSYHELGKESVLLVPRYLRSHVLA